MPIVYTLKDSSQFETLFYQYSQAMQLPDSMKNTLHRLSCILEVLGHLLGEIVFENCVAEFPDHNSVKITYTKENNRTEELTFDTDVRREQNRYFIDMLKGLKPEFSNIEEGLDGVRIVDGAVRSSEADGVPVKL